MRHNFNKKIIIILIVYVLLYNRAAAQGLALDFLTLCARIRYKHTKTFTTTAFLTLLRLQYNVVSHRRSSRDMTTVIKENSDH